MLVLGVANELGAPAFISSLESKMVQPYHYVYVIDTAQNGKIKLIKFPSDQECQALLDCEEYIVLDPLSNTFLNEQGNWEIVPTGIISQENNIVMVR